MARPTEEEILAAYEALAGCVARLQALWAPPLTPDDERELVLDVLEAITMQRQALETLLVAADWRNIETYTTAERARLWQARLALREVAVCPQCGQPPGEQGRPPRALYCPHCGAALLPA